MNVNFYISQSERGSFVHACEAMLQSVGTATRSATEAACKTIISESLKQVPRDTGTLASTAWYHVEAAFTKNSYSKLSNNRYVGYVGYAGSERKGFQVAKKLAGPGSGGAYYEEMPRRTTKYASFKGNHYHGGGTHEAHRTRGTGSSFKMIRAGIQGGHGVDNAINPKTGLPASAYAAIVHEDLSMPHPNGGKAKFLEDPVRDYAASKFRRTVVHYWKYAIEWATMSTANGQYVINRTMPTYMSSDVISGGSTNWKGGAL